MAKTRQDLAATLSRIDSRGYKAYEEIRGEYVFPGFRLFIDHVQADPFAPPSRFRIRVPQEIAKFPSRYLESAIRRIALADYLTRTFSSAAARSAHGHGTGKSGRIFMPRPGQEILMRNSVLISEDGIEARFAVGLPAAGRRILGKVAEEICCSLLPKLVHEVLMYQSLRVDDLDLHIMVAEDSEALRGLLQEHRLVAFVANGSILPRRSGVDDRPLDQGEVIPFTSPPSLEVELEAPNRGKVRGMGIPEGVTLIVGGGYHGKSTLLRAIERGIYDHIPGDGREFVVTSPFAVKIRAEDGRAITNTDISFFISNLPFGADTSGFSTQNASGSTSQAANIVEALESGARVLLVDEDTSATNFMIRDRRMQALVAKEKEPITPFIDRVRLLSEKGISTILVLGGSGDYLDVADTVIMMDEYRPIDVTAKAREIAALFKTGRKTEGTRVDLRLGARIPTSLGFMRPGDRRTKTKARGTDTIMLGHEEIDLSSVEQVVDPGQTRFIADTLRYIGSRLLDGKSNIPELLARLRRDIEEKGMDLVAPYLHGEYSLARPLEIAAALNRVRTLEIRQNR